MIAIIDYGMGNLRSVYKALEKLGYQSIITNDPDEISRAGGVILPGVGAFGAFTENIGRLGLTRPILSFIESGKPFLGICLGLQVLFEKSYEQGEYRGLGVFPGEIIQFTSLPPGLKVPHMGWNSVSLTRESPLFQSVPDGSMVYFVHSFHVTTDRTDIIAATTDYGYEFVAAVTLNNIFGVQFHPEKSGSVGLRILDNFARLCGGSYPVEDCCQR